MDSSMARTWSGMYTMTLKDDPSGVAWFKSDDTKRPNFFFEANAFRPQLTNDFEYNIPYTVNIEFLETYKGYPVLNRIVYGNGGTDGVYMYPRHAQHA